MIHNIQFAIQPHPEIRALCVECGQFAEILTTLITKRDYLRRDVLPAIAAEYNLKIGHLEYKVFWTECELRALKRRIELAQALLNRGDLPCYRCIETQINREFAHWRERIEEKRRELKTAREFAAAPKMSAADTKRFQSLYRNLAKRLHPDLNEPTTRRARLWQQTAEAYASGDLTALETLWLIIENNSELMADNRTHTLENWKEKRRKLFAATIKINDEIAAIRREPPYIWQNILQDEREIARRRVALETKLTHLHESRLRLTIRWAEVMTTAKDAEIIPNAPPALIEFELPDVQK